MTTIVETVFPAPGPQPNGVQATADGLWVLDQKTNQAQFIDYNGQLLRTLDTDSDRGSGITINNGVLWLASTYSREILKVDPDTGATLARYDTPGAVKTGAHGLEWHDGLLWMATPPSATIYAVDVENDFQVVHQIPAPGDRPHGIAWHGEELWCVETNHRAIFRLDPKDGTQLAKIVIAEQYPEPHGMSLWADTFWYCDAHDTADICRLPVPSA